MIILASEDRLIENICLRLISDLGVDVADVTKICPGGKAKLMTRVPAIYRSAMSGIKTIICTDLDSEKCPAQIAEKWFAGKIPNNLIFSVAVREADSWLLADENLPDFLQSKAQVRGDIEKITDPKRHLIGIAKKSRSRRIREDMAVSPKALNRVGPGYNQILSAFVKQHWNYHEASERSKSLKRLASKVELLFKDSQ